MDAHTEHKQRGLFQTTSKEQARQRSHAGIHLEAHAETHNGSDQQYTANSTSSSTSQARMPAAAPSTPADPWASLRPYMEEYSSDTAPDELNLQWALQEYTKAMTAGMVANLSELVRAQSRWGGRGMRQGLPAGQVEPCVMHAMTSSACSLQGMVT